VGCIGLEKIDYITDVDSYGTILDPVFVKLTVLTTTICNPCPLRPFLIIGGNYIQALSIQDNLKYLPGTVLKCKVVMNLHPSLPLNYSTTQLLNNSTT
jgi:hypothetical protein